MHTQSYVLPSPLAGLYGIRFPIRKIKPCYDSLIFIKTYLRVLYLYNGNPTSFFHWNGSQDHRLHPLHIHPDPRPCPCKDLSMYAPNQWETTLHYYITTSSLIGCELTQNDPCPYPQPSLSSHPRPHICPLPHQNPSSHPTINMYFHLLPGNRSLP